MSALQALVPEFRPAMEAYFEAVLALGRRVLRLLALALDLPPTWCAKSLSGFADILICCYFMCSAGIREANRRSP